MCLKSLRGGGRSKNGLSRALLATKIPTSDLVVSFSGLACVTDDASSESLSPRVAPAPLLPLTATLDVKGIERDDTVNMLEDRDTRLEPVPSPPCCAVAIVDPRPSESMTRCINGGQG